MEETGTPAAPLVEPHAAPAAAEDVAPSSATDGAAGGDVAAAPPVVPAHAGNDRANGATDIEAVAQGPPGLGPTTDDPDHLLLQQQEEEEDRQVPPISHHFNRLKYWIWAFRYPMAFVLINVIVIISLFAVLASMIDSAYDRYYTFSDDAFLVDVTDDFFEMDDDNNGGNDTAGEEMNHKAQRVLRSFSIICSLFGLLFLADAILCYKGAKSVEKQLQSLEMGESDDLQMQVVGNGTPRADAQVPFIPLSDRDDADDGGPDPEVNNRNRRPVNFAELSREIDQFLDLPTTTSNATFLISLLFALWALSTCGAEVAAATMIYAKVATNDTLTCLTPYRGFRGDVNEALEKDPAYATFPKDVQDWLHNEEIDRDWFISDDSSDFYVVLENGSIFFLAGSAWRSPIIIEHTKAGEVIKHSDISEPSQLIPVPSAADKNVNSGFCGKGADDHVFCYDPTSGFRKQKGPRRSSSYWSYDAHMHVHDQTVWVFAHVYENDRSHLEVDSVDIKTMGRTKVMESVGDTDSISSIDAECRGMEKMSKANAAVTLALSGVFLYYFQDMPSSTVPISVSAFLFFFVVNAYTGEIFGLVAACVILFLLLPKKLPQRLSILWRYASREMLCWAFYTLLLCVLVGSTNDRVYWDDQTLFLILSIFSIIVGGLLLNHPVFEIMGLVFGVMAVITAISFFFVPFEILFLPLWVVLSLGCWSTGLMIRQYHLHVSVYCRRCWRCICRRRRGYEAAATTDERPITVVVPTGTPQ